MSKVLPAVVLALAAVYFYWSSDGFDPESIRGKRVLITGASSGIGEQLAYEYSKLGAKVFITARRQNLLVKVVKKCKELGAQQVEFVTSNFAEPKDRDKLIAEVQKRLGGLDHLILNHAIMTPGLWMHGSRENMTKLMSDLQVNFVSYVDLTSQALPMLLASKGNIGVVSSIAGKVASAAFASYCADKHALQGFFSALRQELLLRKSGITVTTCVIGPVDTDLIMKSEDRKKFVDDVFSGIDMTADPRDTAVAIMTGVTNRKYEIYYGRVAWFMFTAYKIFPGYFEDYSGKVSLAITGIRD